MNEIKTQALLYDRISSFVQEDGLSLEIQQSGGIAYAERTGLQIVESFTVVESAYKEGRKVFNEMLTFAKKMNIKHLIFKNTDRLSRNLQDLIFIRDLIETKGAHIHFYEMGQIIHAGSSYDEKWVIELLILIAKRHSDKLSHDMKSVYRYKVNKGIAPFRPPFGYIFDKMKKIPVIDKSNENILRYIFDEFDSGNYSLQEFTDLLNSKDIKSPTGKKWFKGSLHYMLTDIYYHGEFLFHDEVFQGIHEPYYQKDRFKERLLRLGEKNVGKRKNYRKYQFSGILRCADCGSILTGDIKKEKYVYYVHSCAAIKKGSYIKEEEISKQIEESIVNITFSEVYGETLKELFLNSIQIKKNESEPDLSVISRRINDLEMRQSKLFDLFATGDMPGEALKRKIDEYQKEINLLEIKRKTKKIDVQKFMITVVDIIDELRQFPITYKESSSEGKAEILKSLVNKVIVSEDKINFEWKAPFSYIFENDLLRFNLDNLGVRDCQVMLPRQDSNLRPIG